MIAEYSRSSDQVFNPDQMYVLNLSERIKEKFLYAQRHQYVFGLNEKPENGLTYIFAPLSALHLRKRFSYYVLIPSDAKVDVVLLSSDVEYHTDKIVIIGEVGENGELPLRFEKATYAQRLRAISADGRAIQFIRNPDNRMKIAALAQDATTLRFIQNPTYMDYFAAVNFCGAVLALVPPEQRDYVLCAAAVIKDPSALQHVPAQHQDQAICLPAIRRDPFCIRFVHEQTTIMSEHALAWDKMAFQYIRNPTDIMIFNAVNFSGLLIEYVKQNLIPLSIKRAAVRQNGMALQHIPVDQRCPIVCSDAVRQTRAAIEFVPAATPNALAETTMEDIDPARAELQQQIVKLVSR